MPDSFRLARTCLLQAGVYCPELYSRHNEFTDSIAMDVPAADQRVAVRVFAWSNSSGSDV